MGRQSQGYTRDFTRTSAEQEHTSEAQVKQELPPGLYILLMNTARGGDMRSQVDARGKILAI